LLEKYGDEKYNNCQKNSNKIGERQKGVAFYLME